VKDLAASWAAIQPKLAAAAEKEATLREEAFFSFPEVLCGVEVKQMTLEHYRILRAAANPFIIGGPAEPAHAVQFMWILSLQFSAEPGELDRFIKRCSAIKWGDCLIAIHGYLEKTFMDIPASPAGAKGGSESMPLDAIITHRLASDYHWTEEEIQGIPIRRLLIYVKMIREEKTGMRFQPLQDKIKGDWLLTINDQGGN
jgi:hypothetical protein